MSCERLNDPHFGPGVHRDKLRSNDVKLDSPAFCEVISNEWIPDDQIAHIEPVLQVFCQKDGAVGCCSSLADEPIPE